MESDRRDLVSGSTVSASLEEAQTLAPVGEMFHISFAGRDLDTAMSLYASIAGGTPTQILEGESWMRIPRVSAEPIRVRDRVALLVGGPLLVEFHEGGPGSPWYRPDTVLALHHVACYVDDLNKAAAALEARGFELEATTAHRGAGILGMAYFKHPNGLVVEIQGSADRPRMEAWTQGEPLVLDWTKDLL